MKKLLLVVVGIALAPVVAITWLEIREEQRDLRRHDEWMGRR